MRVRLCGAVWLASVVAFLLVGWSAFAEPDFPPLTGRVVDQADILLNGTEISLTRTLKRYEEKTSNQVVVVTLKSLQGYAIEDFGLALGRHWGIGQAGRDNGVLLIVAPNERRMRIEVGYGLEGDLTDAEAAHIIRTAIRPGFVVEDFDRGVTAGVDAIIAAIGTELEIPEVEEPWNPFSSDIVPALVLLFFYGSIAVVLYGQYKGYLRFEGGGGYSGHGGIGGIGGAGGGFGGGFGGGGGFSGGGGSFGGGGASGGW